MSKHLKRFCTLTGKMFSLEEYSKQVTMDNYAKSLATVTVLFSYMSETDITFLITAEKEMIALLVTASFDTELQQKETCVQNRTN